MAAIGTKLPIAACSITAVVGGKAAATQTWLLGRVCRDRSYEPEHIKWLNFIRRSRELGFTIQEIRGLLGLVKGRRYTCRQVQEITVRHVADIRRKIADLRRLERVLADMAARCDGGQVPECPIVDALFAPRSEPAGRSRRP